MFVIKLGGSLIKDRGALRSILSELEVLSKEHRLMIVPGGGEFADLVRTYDQEFGLSDNISHKMAILAMDMNGLVISNFSDKFTPVYSLDLNNKLFKKTINQKYKNKIPVLIPSQFLYSRKDIEPSWDVTSDSLSVYIANFLGAEKLILLKSTDSGKDSVDPMFKEFIEKYPVRYDLINGKHPERIKHYLYTKS